MKAIDVLNGELKGTFISKFSVSDTWGLYFGEYWLSAQNLISLDEELLNRWLRANYHSFQKAIDQEYISKCAIVATYMRKEVLSLVLDKACNLTINFEDNGKLILPTNTAIVDWQWSLSEDGSDPYLNYMVACFWEGEIKINKEKNKLLM